VSSAEASPSSWVVADLQPPWPHCYDRAAAGRVAKLADARDLK